MPGLTTEHIAELPQSLQRGVLRWFERLSENTDVTGSDFTGIAKLVACSEFAGNVLLRDWEWFQVCLNDECIAADAFGDLTDMEATKVRLRRHRNRCLLHILWREVHGKASLDETLRRLSDLADEALTVATRVSQQQMLLRHGLPRNAEGVEIPLLILGMGKLGGRELNFSSDIDIIFCYPEGGESDGPRPLSAQEYFTRVARQIIALIDEVTADGFVFRVDTRLRPFGDSGPLVVSLSALESYLLQHGRDWERYAYVKARVVTGRSDLAAIDSLYDDLINPFVYRRYLDYGVFESLREMQAMIATEVRQKVLRDNIKLGPGGIREAEFIVQTLQLVRGGSDPALQGRELQSVLPRLVNSRGLSSEGADQLLAAYRFLRRLENFVQGIRDEQTHDLPADEGDRARLCLAMGFEDWSALVETLSRHREAITAQFDTIALRDDGVVDDAAHQHSRLWASRASAAEWRAALAELMPTAADTAKILADFGSRRPVVEAGRRAGERLQHLIPNLIEQVAKARRPAIALQRTLAVVEKILRRSAYLALLNENRSALSRLVDLCERSHAIADQIARYPVLLDELLDPDAYTDTVTKEDLAKALAERLSSSAHEDSEQRVQAITSFQRATMFRIAVADFNGSLPIMKVSDGLTWLAEVVLDATLRVAWDDLVARHGAPMFVCNGEMQRAEFGIAAYGKLGGLELSYGSDLDIVFLHNASGSAQTTDGAKPIDNARFFGRLVQRLVHFLTTQTDTGALYDIDTRLRPDGQSGLLVSSIDAFARYQEDNAWTWEHQALLRARAVAGSLVVKSAFEKIRRDTLIHRVDREALRTDVISMRQRMRSKLDKSDTRYFDLKHGIGGIGDIEFLVQYLVLREAKAHPIVVQFSDNIRQIDALMDAEQLPKDVGLRLQDIYKLYRLTLHHRVLDGQSSLLNQDSLRQERQWVEAAWHERLE